MSKKTKYYKHPGGVIGFPRIVVRSKAYADLSCVARSLMIELQDVWNPYAKSIHFSVRRASKKMNVGISTACRAFKELESHGFIVCTSDYVWYNGKAREWILTWLSSNGSEPKNLWVVWEK